MKTTHKLPPLFCLCYDCFTLRLWDTDTQQTCGHFICDVSAESSQSSGTTPNVLQWLPHLAWTLSSTYFVLADEDYSATSPDSVVMFQRPTSSLSAVLLKMDIHHILLTLLRGAQVDDLEPPGLITSLLTLACLWPIHFLWHKIVCSRGQSLRPQRLRVPDWLTDCYALLTGKIPSLVAQVTTVNIPNMNCQAHCFSFSPSDFMDIILLYKLIYILFSSNKKIMWICFAKFYSYNL